MERSSLSSIESIAGSEARKGLLAAVCSEARKGLPATLTGRTTSGSLATLTGRATNAREPYRWRKMSARERQEELRARQRRGMPWHELPHYDEGERWYLLTAANFQHQAFMASDERRRRVQDEFLVGVTDMGGEVAAWAVLPNHYHLLTRVPSLKHFGRLANRVHSGTARQWNLEDHAPGRQVWFRYSDRAIRGERHYYASLNYMHGNPVKHGYVPWADQWPCSSIHGYLESLGRDYLRELWVRFAPLEMGKTWDEC